MLLTLTRPLIALDVETHDCCPPERAHICEIGIHVLYHDGRPEKRWGSFIKPGRPITEAATAVHHITNEDVAESPVFAQVAKNLAHGLSDCDFCGYNIKFDLRAFQAEFNRLNIQWSFKDAFLLDSYRLWSAVQKRTLSDAVKYWLNREPTSAHRALGDAEDALEVGLAVVEKHPEVPRELNRLHEFCFPRDAAALDIEGKIVWRADGQVALSFGKHANTPLPQVPRQYLEWCLNKDFPEDMKAILTAALQGNYPKREDS